MTPTVENKNTGWFNSWGGGKKDGYQQVSHQNFSLANQSSPKGPEPLEIHTYFLGVFIVYYIKLAIIL